MKIEYNKNNERNSNLTVLFLFSLMLIITPFGSKFTFCAFFMLFIFGIDYLRSLTVKQIISIEIIGNDIEFSFKSEPNILVNIEKVRFIFKIRRGRSSQLKTVKVEIDFDGKIIQNDLKNYFYDDVMQFVEKNKLNFESILP